MEALYKLRARPGAEGFAAAWDAALERGVQRLEDCAIERAINGTSTPIVSGGQILGYWDKPDNALLRFLLQNRLSDKYGAPQLRPGHRDYDRLRAEIEAQIHEETYVDEATVLASLNRKLNAMKENEEAFQRLLAEEREENDEEEECEK